LITQSIDNRSPLKKGIFSRKHSGPFWRQRIYLERTAGDAIWSGLALGHWSKKQYEKRADERKG